ncbi:MAG: hypothetical protein ACOVT5_15945 [Armatimonadaceae bacterium]
MSKQFKVGDKVRNLHVDNKYHDMRRGEVYTVASLSLNGQFVRFHEKGGGWYPNQFELVAAPAAPVFKSGDKVRIVRKVTEETGWENTWVGDMDTYVGKPDILTISHVEDAGVYFTDFAGDGLGYPPSSLELVVEDAAPTTLRYADLQPGDVIKVTRELTVIGDPTPYGFLRCQRSDGLPVTFSSDLEKLLTIELVSREVPPLTVGDAVRCTLTDKVGTLTGTSEDKYAWVVFGGSTRPKTRLLTELVRP